MLRLEHPTVATWYQRTRMRGMCLRDGTQHGRRVRYDLLMWRAEYLFFVDHKWMLPSPPPEARAIVSREVGGVGDHDMPPTRSVWPRRVI